eukprot:TRINITY_DN3783_c0_g1_i1.p1 TRINITY_DN3783_c0_g1~~TRINITY_DN3783_c0_g1_i1.p1  ORF type:complete len:177 (+),score=50.17 TRINITY_DN3783_c0_g1_i1:78-533(+)
MAAKLARQFQTLQEERTRAFHELEQQHRIFLCHAPDYEAGFDEFKKGVSVVTEKFQKISKEIIEIKETLAKDHPDTKLSQMVERVQDLEEKKLSTVVDLQLASQQALDNPGDELCKKNADLIRTGLNTLSEDITETLTEIRYQVVEIDPPA